VGRVRTELAANTVALLHDMLAHEPRAGGMQVDVAAETSALHAVAMARLCGLHGRSALAARLWVQAIELDPVLTEALAHGARIRAAVAAIEGSRDAGYPTSESEALALRLLARELLEFALDLCLAQVNSGNEPSLVGQRDRLAALLEDPRLATVRAPENP
jgi:hypothetical protein